MKTAKIKIRATVKNYVALFSEEFERFKKEMQIQRSLQANKFASPDHDGVLKQHLLEVPETLDDMFQTTLSPVEWKWFINQEKDGGVFWFAKNFKDFTIAKEI